MDFKILIKKINNSLTKEETTQFQNWYNASETHKAYFKKVVANYPNTLENIDTAQAWNTVESKIKDVTKTNPFWKYGIAASLALLISIATYVLVNKNLSPNATLTEHAIHTGTSKAVLSLQDGSNIALKKGEYYSNEHLKSNGEEVTYSTDAKSSPTEIAYNHLTVPHGGEFELTLSDQTKIWLNSGSKIKYPVSFTQGETRLIELIYGEAYFDISPSTENNGTSFHVKTKGQTIEVLGTEFNVKAYQDDTSIYTTLIEGEISINTYAEIHENLLPGEQSILDLKNNNLSKVTHNNAKKLTAWKEGKFIFNKQSLDAIMIALSRWYNISVTFKDVSKKPIKFSGVLNKDEPITNLLNYFEKTEEVTFKIIDNTIIID